MEVIVNDLSLNGQFSSIEDFTNNLLSEIVPILKMCENNDIQITKKSDIYSKYVTSSENLHSLLLLRGNPIISKLKSSLNKLMCDEPFWDSHSKIDISSNYESKVTSEKINCIYEAHERKTHLISFLNNFFSTTEIEITKNGKEYYVKNFTSIKEYRSYLNYLKILDDYTYLAEECPSIVFFEGRIKTFFEDVCFDDEDRKRIVEDVIIFYENNENRRPQGRFSKSLRDSCFEFRTTLKNSREVRILYFHINQKLLFTNAFLKKTNETPNNEIDNALLCKKKYQSSL